MKHYTIQDSTTHYKTASTQRGQFLVTEKSARPSTRPHYFYCPSSPDFTSRCADCRADTRGHFNCLSVGNKQSMCPLMWGHKRRVGGHQKFFAPTLGPPLANCFRHHCVFWLPSSFAVMLVWQCCYHFFQCMYKSCLFSFVIYHTTTIGIYSLFYTAFIHQTDLQHDMALYSDILTLSVLVLKSLPSVSRDLRKARVD